MKALQKSFVISPRLRCEVTIITLYLFFKKLKIRLAALNMATLCVSYMIPSQRGRKLLMSPFPTTISIQTFIQEMPLPFWPLVQGSALTNTLGK